MGTTTTTVRGAVEVGDVISFESKYWGTLTGRVVRVNRFAWCHGASSFEVETDKCRHQLSLMGGNWKIVERGT